ncbi:MAG: tol-pal system protein YbgF [Alteromonas macleodii]|jgi:tol-pal system protein YbgF
MLKILALIVVMAFSAGGAFAQEQKLANIRLELSVLYSELNVLRDELLASGQSGQNYAGATLLDRLNTIEAELTRLTSKTENLEFRIVRITRDGTNRIGDLEFRLCELETDCEISLLGETPSLGGVDLEPADPALEVPLSDGLSLAIGEKEDFTRAQEALATGNFRGAVDLLATFNQTYPGSPVASESHLLRGRAYEQMNEIPNAARAYLAAFSGNPEGPLASSALTRLGKSLAILGQLEDACVTLGEVSVRFPGAAEVGEARQAMANLGCS